MKVLHVLDHSAPKYDGYAFRSLEIIRFLRGAGLETAQLTSAKHGATTSDEEVVDDLLHYRTAPGNGFLGRLPIANQWDVVVSLERRLREVVALEQPDVIHAHSPALNGLAALRVAREHGIPTVYEIRAFWEDAAVDKGACSEGDLRYRVTRAMETRVVRRVDHVVCICEGLRRDIADRGVPSDRLSVVPNAVDLERFSADGARDDGLAGDLGLSPGRTLGFIGSFFAFEGLEVLVRAVRPLLAVDPKFRVLIVGDGVQGDALRALARAEGVAEAVIFTGRIPQTDVGAYYDLVDLFVYPRVSMRITELVTPLKPLEAMAKQRNVLASDVGGHRELIRADETGVLFRAGDPQDLARQAVDLLDAPERAARLRANALAYVRDERDWRVNVGRYLDIYRGLAERRMRSA